MRKRKYGFTLILNIIIVLIIAACFLLSSVAISNSAKKDCFNHIEETTMQMSHTLKTSMDDAREKLEVFADILAANSSNPDDLLKIYMENFCRTQDFSATCIHRKNGTSVYHGTHPHEPEHFPSFEDEMKKVPYISEVQSIGDVAENKMFYQAVPIIRNGETAGILYGYMPLSKLPGFVTSVTYNGKSQFYIVDGNTGDFLMDTWHSGKLGNVYDGSMGDRVTKDGYSMENMIDGIKNGKSGYFIFQSRTTGDWFYTYYMPTGINNWSIQMTIDETTAFENYTQINKTIISLGIIVVFLTILYIVFMMLQSACQRKRERARFNKTDYMYKVQQILFNAHNNADLIERGLQMTGNKLEAETVLILTFKDKEVVSTYYWPSKDKFWVTELIGRNIRDDFPVLFDVLLEGKSIVYDIKNPNMELSESAIQILSERGVETLRLVPMLDNGTLSGVLCAVNVRDGGKDCEMMECVLYNFFAAVRNVENYEIIKNMGMMDYLTDMKNRNSYEVELGDIAAMDYDSLWCIFVDVNGLHEVNNTYGHKAGDLMICTVAKVVKNVFGTEHSYRLGGDEFVAFAMDKRKEQVEEKKALMESELAKKGYNVSVGFAPLKEGGRNVLALEHLVSEAESMMYEEKKAYYERNNIAERNNETKKEK